jgi:hypothetical protein
VWLVVEGQQVRACAEFLLAELGLLLPLSAILGLLTNWESAVGYLIVQTLVLFVWVNLRAKWQAEKVSGQELQRTPAKYFRSVPLNKMKRFERVTYR